MKKKNHKEQQTTKGRFEIFKYHNILTDIDYPIYNPSYKLKKTIYHKIYILITFLYVLVSYHV